MRVIQTHANAVTHAGMQMHKNSVQFINVLYCYTWVRRFFIWGELSCGQIPLMWLRQEEEKLQWMVVTKTFLMPPLLKPVWITKGKPGKSEAQMSWQLLHTLLYLICIPLLYIHDKGDAGFVWERHLTKGIQTRKRRMTERDVASADRKHREVRVCNEAGEQEIISQVRWEADAALTS